MSEEVKDLVVACVAEGEVKEVSYPCFGIKKDLLNMAKYTAKYSTIVNRSA